MQTVKGIYKDGKVELTEFPEGIQESEVIVTFLPAATRLTPHLMTFGMFHGEVQSTEADLQLAEFQGDAEDGLTWD